MYLVNNQLVDSLPFRITLPSGNTRTALSEMNEKELVELGIIPCKILKDEIKWTQHYGDPKIEIKDTFAEVYYPVMDYSPAEVEEILNTAREQKAQEIRQASDALFTSLQAGYTLGEVASFERQKSGAKAILAGDLKSEDAQYVASLASVRQAGGDKKIDPATLAGKIMKNALAAEQAIVAILGHQQGLEVKAREAKTLEELEAILW